MDKEIETLKHLTVNLDSATAERIANQYVNYRYFDSICGLTLLAVIVAAIIYFVNKAMNKD